MLRTSVGYLAEILGFSCLVMAAYRVSLTVALVVLGVGLIVGAQAARQ